jgi:hypothetical protein
MGVRLITLADTTDSNMRYGKYISVWIGTMLTDQPPT